MDIERIDWWEKEKPKSKSMMDLISPYCDAFDMQNLIEQQKIKEKEDEQRGNSKVR